MATITLTDSGLNTLREMIAATYEAADGDSNDEEIEALQAVRDALEEMLPVLDEDEYADHKWDGEDTAVIESETAPWITDGYGPVDFGRPNSPIPGVWVGGTVVERLDESETYPSDLHAAAALAKHLDAESGFTVHEVWFRGTL